MKLCVTVNIHKYASVILEFKRKMPPWVRRLVAGLAPRRTAFDTDLVHADFVVNKVALRQALPRVLRSPPASSIPPMLHTHSSIYHQRYIMFATNSVVKYFVKNVTEHSELGGGVGY